MVRLRFESRAVEWDSLPRPYRKAAVRCLPVKPWLAAMPQGLRPKFLRITAR